MEINKTHFLSILRSLTECCTYTDYGNYNFRDVKKFKNLLELIDLNEYIVDYIQNRFITIRSKQCELKNINNILICPFDTYQYEDISGQVENTIFDYSRFIKKRKSYLIEPINGSSNTQTNEKDCIKGKMNPSLLNAIVVYMLQYGLIMHNTLVIFPLKSNDSQWHGDDILEYLQNHIDKFNCDIKMLVDMGICANPKGMPQKDYIGNFIFQTDYDYIGINRISLLRGLQNENFIEKVNYRINVNHDDRNAIYNFSIYNKMAKFYDINLIFRPRIFVFYDKEPTNKFSTFYLNDKILTEWDSIKKYIEILNRVII